MGTVIKEWGPASTRADRGDTLQIIWVMGQGPLEGISVHLLNRFLDAWWLLGQRVPEPVKFPGKEKRLGVPCFQGKNNFPGSCVAQW